MDLAINVRENGPSRTVVLAGSCDLSTAPHLRQALQGLVPPEVTDVTIDVTDLDFIDSTGLGVVLGAMRRLREGRGVLRIAGARGIVLRVLEITDLDKVIPLTDTAAATE